MINITLDAWVQALAPDFNFYLMRAKRSLNKNRPRILLYKVNQEDVSYIIFTIVFSAINWEVPKLR